MFNCPTDAESQLTPNPALCHLTYMYCLQLFVTHDQPLEKFHEPIHIVIPTSPLWTVIQSVSHLHYTFTLL